MVIAEVVETAYDVHASHQGFGAACQSTCTSHQIVQSQAEGGIEPFDEGGIDDAFALLRGFDQPFNHFLAALNNASVHAEYTFHALFDNLYDGNIWPGNQLAATYFAWPVWQFAAKGKLKSSHITGQAIHGQQQRTTKRNRADFVCQGLDQFQVACAAHHAAQPQARTHRDCQRHPVVSFLNLDLDLIRLDLLQILLTFLNPMLMHTLTMPACSFMPIAHRALIQPKGFDDRLNWTTICQQDNHTHHSLRIAAQPIEYRIFTGCEGLLTNIANAPLVDLAVNLGY